MAFKRRLKLSNLRDETFVMPTRKTSPFFRREIENICVNLGGFVPRIRLEADNLYTMLNFLSDTDNITLLPESFAFARYPELTFKRLEGCPLKMANSAIWKADNPSPVLGNFLEMLKLTLGKAG